MDYLILFVIPIKQMGKLRLKEVEQLIYTGYTASRHLDPGIQLRQLLLML